MPAGPFILMNKLLKRNDKNEIESITVHPVDANDHRKNGWVDEALFEKEPELDVGGAPVETAPAPAATETTTKAAVAGEASLPKVK